MSISKRWQAKPALLMTFSMLAAGLAPVVAAPAIASPESRLVAQSLFDSARAVVPAGTVVQVSYESDSEDDEEADKIIVTPDETAPLTLTVTSAIRSSSGTTLIPAGSTIEGELRPLTGSTPGTQFYAEELTLPSGNRYELEATSAPVTRTEIITEESDRDFIKGAVIGAAAAAVLSEIFGSIDILEVLGGAGLGALGILIFGGRDEEVEVVVVDPNTDLDLTLTSDFRL